LSFSQEKKLEFVLFLPLSQGEQNICKNFPLEFLNLQREKSFSETFE